MRMLFPEWCQRHADLWTLAIVRNVYWYSELLQFREHCFEIL